MTELNSGIDSATLLVLGGIWLLVGLGFYIWWGWSLSRLFRRIGLNPVLGWIPVVNLWQLIKRGGGPGWTVLFSFIGFGIIPLIFEIMAIHRINNEYGRGGGMTVVGIFFQPIWAMVLASHIDRTGAAYGGPRAGGASMQADPRPTLRRRQVNTRRRRPTKWERRTFLSARAPRNDPGLPMRHHLAKLLPRGKA